MWGIEFRLLEFSISITGILPIFQHFSSLANPIPAVAWVAIRVIWRLRTSKWVTLKDPDQLIPILCTLLFHLIAMILLYLKVRSPVLTPDDLHNKLSVFYSINSWPNLFIAMLEMDGNIRNVPDEQHRGAYFATAFCAIVARLDSGYPDDPRAFHMAQFVWVLSLK